LSRRRRSYRGPKREPKKNMFPGCVSSSQLLQDIRDNYRSQTLVSVQGFTAKPHMFVQPLASRRAAGPSSSQISPSSQAPRASGSPVSPHSSHESASSSSARDVCAHGRFVPSWVTYHGVVRCSRCSCWSRWWNSLCPPTDYLIPRISPHPIQAYPSVSKPIQAHPIPSHLTPTQLHSPGALVPGGPSAGGGRRDRPVPPLGWHV